MLDHIVTKATAVTARPALFNVGVVNCMPEAGSLLGRDAKGVEATNEIIADMVGRHMTADFGVVPREVVTVNIYSIVEDGDNRGVLSCFPLDKTKTAQMDVNDDFPKDSIIVLTECKNGGDPVTWLLSADEMALHMLKSMLGDLVRDLAPGIKLAGMAPRGNA